MSRRDDPRPAAASSSRTSVQQQRFTANRGAAASSPSRPLAVKARSAESHAARSYAMALRSQWTYLVQLVKEQHLNASSVSDLNGSAHQLSVAAASAAATHVGLDAEMCRVLRAIRADALRAASEAEELLPLLLALSMAPIPNDVVQTLAAEVLAKLLVALRGAASSHDGTSALSTAGGKVMEVFLLQHHAVDAVQLALETAVSADVLTSLLELLFVMASSSMTAAAAMLTSPALIKRMLAMLQSAPAGGSSGVISPAQACYVAAVLHTLARVPDGPAILCSYDTHHRVVTFLYESAVESITATAVAMLLRVVVALIRSSPLPFRALWRQGVWVKWLSRLVRSPWAEIADLACIVVTAVLSARTVPVEERRQLSQRLSSSVSQRHKEQREELCAHIVRQGGEVGELVPTLASLAACPQPHVAVSAAFALLHISVLSPTEASDALFGHPTGLHSAITVVMDEDDDEVGVAPDSCDKPQQQATKFRRVLTAVALAWLMVKSSHNSRSALTKHLKRHTAPATRGALRGRLEALMATLDASFFEDTVALSLTTTTDDVHNLNNSHQQRPSAHDIITVLCCGVRDVLTPRDALLSSSSAAMQAPDQRRDPHSLLSVSDDLVAEQPKSSTHNSIFIRESIRVVTQLASHYSGHCGMAAAQQTPESQRNAYNQSLSVTALGSSRSSSAQTCRGVYDASIASSANKGVRFSTVAKGKDHLGSAFPSDTPKNDWAPPKKHDVDRKWSVEHLKRDDVLLFDCPFESLVPGLEEVMSSIVQHLAHLGHELKLCSTRYPLRRCVLQDLHQNVYPTMLTCLQYIVQELGQTRTAARVVLDGLAQQVTSANVLDLYHAIGLAASQYNEEH